MKILGIDIGGSGIKGAPVDTDTGELLAERFRLPTPEPATPKKVAQTVTELVQHFDWTDAVGYGFPAAIQHGIVRTASNIDKSWIGTNVVELFSKATNCLTGVINDADAAGLAEMKFGAGKDQPGVILMITVGTGLGTAIFSDGKLLPNTEFGHVILRNKIAEHYASDASRKDKELSWKKWGKRFDKYLNRLEDLLWPDMIIIGGGASKKFDRFSEYFTVKAHVMPARLLNDAGIIGAALAAELIIG
jgi:polyphosphate glucokinase